MQNHYNDKIIFLSRTNKTWEINKYYDIVLCIVIILFRSKKYVSGFHPTLFLCWVIYN